MIYFEAFHIKEYNFHIISKKNKESAKRELKTTTSTNHDQTLITDFKKRTIDEATSKLIDDQILRYICLSCEPLSITERNGFAGIFGITAPGYIFLFIKSITLEF